MNILRIIGLLACCLIICIPATAAPLNKFGTMTQQAPPAQQLISPVQQAAPAYTPPQAQRRDPSDHSAKNADSLKRIRAILSRLSVKQLEKWEKRFARKHNKAALASKDAMQAYYDKLMKMSQQIIKQKREESQ